MLRRSFRLGLRLGLLAAAVAITVKAFQLRRSQLERFPQPRADDWPPIPAPPAGSAAGGAGGDPSGPSAARGADPNPGAGSAPGPDAWVPAKDKTCPATHPVKAKLSSRIFHLPGMAAYERTRPDRCYRDEPAAQADGLRRAKR